MHSPKETEIRALRIGMTVDRAHVANEQEPLCMLMHAWLIHVVCNFVGVKFRDINGGQENNKKWCPLK